MRVGVRVEVMENSERVSDGEDEKEYLNSQI